MDTREAVPHVMSLNVDTRETVPHKQSLLSQPMFVQVNDIYLKTNHEYSSIVNEYECERKRIRSRILKLVKMLVFQLMSSPK